jgi:hypothetical protein
VSAFSALRIAMSANITGHCSVAALIGISATASQLAALLHGWRQGRDVMAGVGERPQLAAVGERNRLSEFA